MLIRFTGQGFPHDYVPSILETFQLNFNFNDVAMQIDCIDTAFGSDEFRDSMAPLQMACSCLFVFCFALDDEKSLQAIETTHLNTVKQWYNESQINAVLVRGVLHFFYCSNFGRLEPSATESTTQLITTLWCHRRSSSSF